ncbi:hypothetical protein [Streptomyces capitiformicae]|nr:hypothetical protein [Streptomyces capitiformicae]
MALLVGLTAQAAAENSVGPTGLADSTSTPSEDSTPQPGPPTEPEEDVTEIPSGDVDRAPELPQGTGKPSEQPAGDYCGPPVGVYKPVAKKGKKIKGIGPAQGNFNSGTHPAKSRFIAEAGGEVGIAVSGELKVSASAMVGEIEKKFGVELSFKMNAKIGNWIEVKTPPGKTTHAQYGVWRMKNTGTSYIIYSNCKTSPKKTITSYAPWHVGWHIWES